MCFATANKIPSLVNSAGTFIGGKFNDFCFLACVASCFAFFTLSGMQRKLSSMGGVPALHLFSYSSKCWPAMWLRHVEFDPRRKHALSTFFERVPSFIASSVAALECQVSNGFFYRRYRVLTCKVCTIGPPESRSLPSSS
jgi:hypothetical protein